LELLEKVDLPEGQEVTITILDIPSSEDQEAFRCSTGKWKGHVDAEALIRTIYATGLSPHGLSLGYDDSMPR